MPIPLVVLFIVFALIALRQVLALPLRIWQIMLGGAVVVLITGSISPLKATHAVNQDVMIFLAGMFVLGYALEESGYLMHLSQNLFQKARSVDHLVLLVLFTMGILSSFLMNDTLAIIGTPLVIHFARKHKIAPQLLLLALCFSVTIGSVFSPIGNPQNLLVALEGKLANPFVTFFLYLALPSLINLYLAYWVLKIFYSSEFHPTVLAHEPESLKDPPLSRLCKLSIFLVLALIALKVIAFFSPLPLEIQLTYIAVAAALPLIFFSPKRWLLLRKMDWPTLVFFVAMFILMESVWETGFFQNLLEKSKINLAAPGVVMTLGVLVSQLISNVPFVALYLPLLQNIESSTQTMMALAAGSTIAGNLLILGAASNVIVIQNAENKGETLTFYEFARVGIPLTAINVAVYWAWLFWMGSLV